MNKDNYIGPITIIVRWCVNFNGIGSISYCPVVRKTKEMQALVSNLDDLRQVKPPITEVDTEFLAAAEGRRR